MTWPLTLNTHPSPNTARVTATHATRHTWVLCWLARQTILMTLTSGIHRTLASRPGYDVRCGGMRGGMDGCGTPLDASRRLPLS